MMPSITDLTSELKQACRDGDLDKVKYLLTSPELMFHAAINVDTNESDTPLSRACESGHLNIVKYLLTSPDLFEKALINDDGGSALAEACWGGHLDIIKYLLTSPELSEHANIHNNDSIAIKFVCYKNYVGIAKYLLTSPELKEHAKVNNDDPELAAIVKASEGNSLEIIKFLLSSEELNDKPNQTSIEEAFKVAYRENYTAILEYLIFEYNLERTETINEFISNINSRQVESMFETRELSKSLQKELNSDKNNIKRTKL